MNAALQSESDARCDSTLLAVVILTYFEATTGSDRGSVRAWSNHIRGTAALIENRGVEQTKTDEGRMLFLMATTNLVLNCSRLALRIPECIHNIWNTGLKDLAEPNDPVWRVHTAWLRLVDFYSDVMNKRKNPIAVVPEALRLDHDFSSAFNNAPDQWLVDEFPAVSGSPGLPAYVHYYKTSLSAHMWNSMRCGRLILHSIISKTLWQISLMAPEAAGKPATEQLRMSASLVKHMKIHILASVPQYIGIQPPSDASDTYAASTSHRVIFHENLIQTSGSPRSPTSTSARQISQSPSESLPAPPGSTISSLLTLQSNRLPVLRTSRGYDLVWSLALVADLTDRANPLKLTTCHYMRQTGAKLGIQQAFRIADTIENGEDTVP